MPASSTFRPYTALSTFARRSIVFIGMALATPLLAQSSTASSTTTVAARADSIAATGDTATALAVLDSAIKANKRDGAAWHQLGLIQWNMARSKRSGGYINDPKAIRQLRAADSALRLSTQFSPDSARFWISLSNFGLQSGVASVRFASGGFVSNALEAAERLGDSLQIALASDEVGSAVWRRYEPIANRALVSDGQQRIQLSMFNNWSRSQARGFIDSFIRKIMPPTGDRDYTEATARYRRAVENDPTNLRYSRHLFMALGERNRWDETFDIASRRARQYPLDYQAQLARGLAAHRLGNANVAQAAFDSAFVLMDETESRRLSRFTRILRPRPTKETKGTVGDTLSFSQLPAAQQRGLEQMYWFMNDPLTLTNENEFRLEFLSRVTWSDFRWTVDELGLRGADTDRGDVYVRYGPPELEITVPGASSFQGANTDGAVTLVWGYRSGLVFFFDLPPGFGTARYAFVDKDNVEQIKSNVPVLWDNIPSTRMIDTIPIRVARFRAGGDSTDAVIASLIPVDSLVRGLDIDRASVDIDFRIFDQFVRVTGVESSQQTIGRDSATGPQSQRWIRRMGPGINVIRVEALQTDSRRAARAMTRISPENTTGYGMSDILLGDTPTPPATGAPARWRNVAMTPSQGTFAQGSSVGMVWELYELSAREGSTKYRVGVSVERVDRTAVGNFAARIVDGLGRTIGREQRSRDKISIGFDRTAAPSATIVESLSLSLTDQAAGRYRLRIDITDLGNGKKTSRETEFTIR